MAAELREIIAGLPEQPISEILRRLPAKCIVPFRSVSESLLSFIDSPGFVQLHLEYSKLNSLDRSLLLYSSFDLCSIDLPDFSSLKSIDLPFEGDVYNFQYLGSCDGLLFLLNSVNHDGDGMVLYNPAISQHRKLPVAPTECTDPHFKAKIAYGFGRDNLCGDYKAVSIVQSSVSTEVKVYSLSSGSWKIFVDFSFEYYLAFNTPNGVYINGCLHWVMYPNPSSLPGPTGLIVVFDLGLEQLGVFPLPENLAENTRNKVCVFDGCLCVLSTYLDEDKMDVWVMKDYGVQQSWDIMFSVSHENIGHFCYASPLITSNHGIDVLLEVDGSRLLWYNLIEKIHRSVYVDGVLPTFGCDVFVESLVPLERHEEKKRTEEKRDELDGFLSEGFKLKL